MKCDSYTLEYIDKNGNFSCKSINEKFNLDPTFESVAEEVVAESIAHHIDASAGVGSVVARSIVTGSLIFFYNN